MPKTGQTVRTENGETYRLAEWLGGGTLAAVWRGVAEESEIAEQVAIKIADLAMRQQFDTEYDTLSRMLNAGAETWPGETGTPLVPAFIHKATLEPDGQAVLVTELIQVDTLTKLVLDEGDLARRQELLVEPAYQYAWFLDFVHNQVGISQSDRKLGDLYWDAEQRRLIVLGWGVVEKGTERAPEDVYKFGEMWYALLLGVTPALSLGVTTSREWDQLSVAWRSVLEACLRPSRQARPTTEKLSAMMEQRRDVYLQTAEVLAQKGQQALEQAKEDLRQSERAWWLLDLAGHKGLEDARLLSRKAESLFRGRGQRLLEDASFNLELGMFSKAKAALNEAESETDNSPEFQLRVARWHCLVDAAKIGLAEEAVVQFRDIVHYLIAAVEALETGQWPKVAEELEPALVGFPENSKIRVMLQSLERESDLYQVLTEATDRRGNGKFLEAAEKYQDARDLLSEIVYQNAVELTIVDLAHEKVECERLAETEGKLRDAQVQIARLVNGGSYAKARSLYDEVLLLTRGKVEAREALDAVFAPVRGLQALSQACQRLKVPAEELTIQAQDLLARFPDNTAVQREAGQVVTVLLPELERCARETKFIDDIDGALNLGWTLQSLGESARVTGAILERCKKAVANLEGKRVVYQQAIKLYEGDFHSRTRAIRIVRRAGIELFRDKEYAITVGDNLLNLETERFDEIMKEYKRQKSALEQAQLELGDLVYHFEQSIQDVRDLEAEVTPEKRDKVQKVVDQLYDFVHHASEQQRILENLPTTEELDDHVARRSELMTESCLQRYLEVVVNALRCFRPDIATHAWDKITEIISSTPDLKVAYDDNIELVGKEYQIQSQWNDEILGTLSNWRRGLESKSLTLQDDDMERLDEYWQQTSSVFVGEVSSLARSDRAMRSAFVLLTSTEHAKSMDDTHQKMLALLVSSAPVIECLEQLEAFDRQWRPELDKTAIPGQNSRHSEFMMAWRNRIGQAQAMERTLRAVEHLLTLKQAPPTLVFQYLTRMEIMVETVANEVVASCADRWQKYYDRVIQLLINNQANSADSVYLDQIKASFRRIVDAKARQGKGN